MMSVFRLSLVLALLFCTCAVQADSLPKGSSDEDKRLKQVVAEKLADLFEFGIAYSIAAIALRSERSEMHFLTLIQGETFCP